MHHVALGLEYSGTLLVVTGAHHGMKRLIDATAGILVSCQLGFRLDIVLRLLMGEDRSFMPDDKSLHAGIAAENHLALYAFHIVNSTLHLPRR